MARPNHPSKPRPGFVGTRAEANRVPADAASARLTRKTRLRKHADFENVYRSGRKLFFKHMTVFFLRQDSGLPHQPTGRVGFTVPRALGTAVERNRIRRRMREAVRLNLGALGGALDVVIHPKKSALTADFAELREETVRAFEKIRSSSRVPSLRSGQA